MDESELRRLSEIAAHLRRQVQPATPVIAEFQSRIQANLKSLRQAVPALDMARMLGRLQTDLAPLLRIQLPESRLRDVERLQGWFHENQQHITVTLERVRAAYRQTLSDNLKPLDLDLLMRAVKLMMQEDGVVVVWLPPSDIVTRLVEASSLNERNAIVVERGGDIASSAEELLKAVEEPHLQLLRKALTEAWAVWACGHRMAAQALATAALGTVVHELLAYEKFSSLKDEWRREGHDSLDQLSLLEMRQGLLLVRTAVALENTRHEIPGYNRHGSAHMVDQTYYSDANAMYALMLVTAWARELQANCIAQT